MITAVILTTPSENAFSIAGINEDGERSFRCQCPVHGGNGNSFAYYSNTRSWKCWSNCCHELNGGDLIGLVSSCTGCSREEARQRLNLPIIGKRVRKSTNETGNKKLDKAIIEKDYASPYFEGRGFKPETIKYFMSFECSDPKQQMYNRAVIPIFDEENNLIGLTGRTTKFSIIKWFHWPMGLKKSKVLYNLNNVKDADTVILVEGPLDVWKLYECGITNAVAILGTEISNFQILMLKKYGIKKVILMLDPDAAGKKATLNGITNKLVGVFKTYSLRHLLSKDIGETSHYEIITKIKPEILKICTQL